MKHINKSSLINPLTIKQTIKEICVSRKPGTCLILEIFQTKAFVYVPEGKDNFWNWNQALEHFNHDSKNDYICISVSINQLV